MSSSSSQSNPAQDLRPVVLVIDDSVDVQRLLRARLIKEELSFVSAYSGDEALMIAERLQPSLITLDLSIPGCDGFDILKQLKSNPATRQIPVIILSLLSDPERKERAFELGAIDYIAKPFELAELKVRVHSAIRTYQLLQMLAQKAKVDGLTGLWNRAFFETRWNEEYASASRYNRPLSLLMLDADRFKSINDEFGHPAGDALLQGLARLLVRECRQTDLACRYGGEELVVILPGTTSSEATILAERIRKAIELTVWPRHPARRVTVSIGVAGCESAPNVSAEKWVELVDQNLYLAKHDGRNRVVATIMKSGADDRSSAA